MKIPMKVDEYKDGTIFKALTLIEQIQNQTMGAKIPRKAVQLRYCFFPCLRCAQFAVTAFVPRTFERLNLPELICEKCCAPHYLMAEKEGSFWWMAYDRHTRRYPPDHYDEEPQYSIAPFREVSLNNSTEDDRSFHGYGPILIYRRKRCSRNEVHAIWLRSGRRCHSCGKRWRLNQHGSKGWHIDHEIPNSGGGRDTETIGNFLVACANCNLKKGNGRPEILVKQALKRFFS